MSAVRGQLQSSDQTADVSLDARFLRESGIAARIADAIEPVLVDLGYRLVRVVVSGRLGQTVQIMAERPDGTMTAGDCERVSHAVSPVIDVLDPIENAFNLEVSSPGIDRPLVRPSDFEDWAGHEARIELKEMISGRKRYKGTLEGVADNEVRMLTEVQPPGVAKPVQEVVGFPLDLISEARLVMTDDLIRASLTRAKKAREARRDTSDDDGAMDGAEMPDDLSDVTPVPKRH